MIGLGLLGWDTLLLKETVPGLPSWVLVLSPHCSKGRAWLWGRNGLLSAAVLFPNNTYCCLFSNFQRNGFLYNIWRILESTEQNVRVRLAHPPEPGYLGAAPSEGSTCELLCIRHSPRRAPRLCPAPKRRRLSVVCSFSPHIGVACCQPVVLCCLACWGGKAGSPGRVALVVLATY